MSRLKDIALVVLAAALVAEYWHAGRKMDALREQATAARKQSASWQDQYRRIKQDRDQPPPTPRGAAASVAAEPADAMELRLAGILDRARVMKAWFDAHPDQRIGEFAFLTDEDWISLGRKVSQLNSDEDYRKAAAQLRADAENNFMHGELLTALKAYFKASNNTLPGDIQQLSGFLAPGIDPSLLQHYEMIAYGTSKETENMPLYALNPQTTVVDPTYDEYMVGMGLHGTWSMNGGDTAFYLDKLQADNAYKLANGGQPPASQDLLAPYFKNSQFAARFLAQLPQAKN